MLDSSISYHQEYPLTTASEPCRLQVTQVYGAVILRLHGGCRSARFLMYASESVAVVTQGFYKLPAESSLWNSAVINTPSSDQVIAKFRAARCSITHKECCRATKSADRIRLCDCAMYCTKVEYKFSNTKSQTKILFSYYSLQRHFGTWRNTC
jgi:hypothetical protein